MNVPSVQLATMDRVEPGSSTSSSLVHKITGSHRAVGGVGQRMPPTGALSSATITTIQTWVNEGAPFADADGDGDGYDSAVDCDAADAGVHPGATEIPDDGVAQDCDGVDATAGGPLAVDDLGAGEPVITEIHYHPLAVVDPRGEWFEVQNVSGSDVDLAGLVVSDLGGQTFTVGSSLVVSAGDFVVFGLFGVPALNGGVTPDPSYTSLVFDNPADELVLANASGTLDAVAYDVPTGWPNLDGASMTLDLDVATPADNDVASNWCAAVTTYSATDAGTPGAANEDCAIIGADEDGDGWIILDERDDTDATMYPYAPEVVEDGVDQDCDGVDLVDADDDGWAADEDCDDGDATVYPGATDTPADGIDQDCDGADAYIPTTATVADLLAGDPVITEVLQNPSASSDTYGEWFEVYNASGVDVDLNGLLVTDLGSDSFTVSGSLIVAAGDYVVLGVDADTTRNGTYTPDHDYASFSLGNADDELVLSYAALVIDQIAWDGGPAWPDPNGASMNLDPAAIDATLNDDPTNRCTAPTTTFGAGDRGTPGAINDSCS